MCVGNLLGFDTRQRVLISSRNFVASLSKHMDGRSRVHRSERVDSFRALCCRNFFMFFFPFQQLVVLNCQKMHLHSKNVKNHNCSLIIVQKVKVFFSSFL